MQDIKNRVNTFRSTVFTRNKLNCSGCGACAQICAHGAIKMQEDSEGFLFPQIDSEKCVLCGLCDKTCPEVNSRFENNQSNQQFYIAANKRPQQYKDCATIGFTISAGLFATLSMVFKIVTPSSNPQRTSIFCFFGS